MNRRNTTIANLRIVASDPHTSVESRLVAMHKLTRLRPGKPLAHFIRATLKEILRDHPDNKGLFVDVRQVLDDLNETRRQKLRFLELKRTTHAPPFPVPHQFKEQFRWIFKIHREGRIEWALHER